LYVTFSGLPNPTGRYISQYDLSSNDSLLITTSKNIIYWTSYANPILLDLQNTRQGIIKVALYYRDSIGAIMNPNAYGTACNYQTFPLTFNGRRCKEQFPNINTNYYNPNTYVCSNAIPEMENEDIRYFPNPVTDKLALTNLEGKFKNLNIYSVDGRIVLFKQIDFIDKTEIDISRLPSGIYIVELVQYNHSKIKLIKFVKSDY
jgi:hypothetical protein